VSKKVKEVLDQLDEHRQKRDKEYRGAILDTRFLNSQVKSNLANGLCALYLELERNKRAGYGEDMTKEQRVNLAHHAREAYALGLLAYLPPFVGKELGDG
jgi:hypothetical protein